MSVGERLSWLHQVNLGYKVTRSDRSKEMFWEKSVCLLFGDGDFRCERFHCMGAMVVVRVMRWLPKKSHPEFIREKIRGKVAFPG